MTEFVGADEAALREFAPLLRRTTALEPNGVVRIVVRDDAITCFVRLPFGVLASRAVATAAPPPARRSDVTVGAAELLARLENRSGAAPQRRDAEWRTGLPPTTGWHRLDTVPDDAIRSLVRNGAKIVTQAAAGLADALLDATVLTVDDGDANEGDANKGDANKGARRRAELSLRTVSALTKLGFLPRGGSAHVDTAGRWTRLVAEYGTVYAERAGAGLTIA